MHEVPLLGPLGGDHRHARRLRAGLPLLHRRASLPALTARIFRPLYLFLLNKWYFDELYDRLFVRPAFWLGACSGRAATARSSTGSADGIAAAVLAGTTGRTVKLQTGYVYHYAFAMLIGVAPIITWFMFYGGAVR